MEYMGRIAWVWLLASARVTARDGDAEIDMFETEDVWCRELTDTEEIRSLVLDLGRSKDYVGALRCAERLIELNVTDERAWSLKAECQLYRNVVDDAVRCAQRSIDLRPSADAYFLLGTAHMGNSSHGQAVEAFRAGLALSSDNLNILVNLGVALSSQNDYPEAISVYHRALAIRPGALALTELIGSCRMGYRAAWDRGCVAEA